MAKDDTYYPPKTLENTVRAPYNFVPFTDRQPFMRYTDVSKLPAHDELCADLLTGEIHLTLTAETSVFVFGRTENAEFLPRRQRKLYDSRLYHSRHGKGEYADSWGWFGSQG